MRKHQRFDNCAEFLAQILPHKYAVNIQTGLETRFDGLKKPRRAIRSLNDFLSFVVGQDVTIEKCEELSLLFHSYQEMVMTESQHLAPTTIESNLRTLKITIESLQSSNIFPKGHIASVMRQADRALFQDPMNDAKKVLGGLELPIESKDEDIPLTLRLNVSTDEFLASLVTTIRKHRNTLLHISRSYLEEANSRLDYKEFAVDFVPASLFDNPENLTLCANSKGQRYSLFHPTRLGEIAKMNMVAYIHYKQDGLIVDDFKGRLHLSSFGGTGELREYFGLSSLSAVAAQIIIIIESGINVSSLRDFRVDSNGGVKDSFRITDDGFNIIYEKLRAGSPRNKQMNFVDDSYINIEYAFNYLVRSTKHHRKMAPKKYKEYLFIHDTMKTEGDICRISDMAFKGSFTKLLEKAKERLLIDPMWCKHVTTQDIDDLLPHKPNAPQVRVSEGILRWYDSGGDSLAAANYLGNSEAVALNNYLPKELQGVLYSQQISRFQHLLLAAATDKKNYQKEVLQLDSANGFNDYYEEYISQLDILNPNWRKLAESNEIKSTPKNDLSFALIMNKESVSKLYDAFEEENSALQNGLAPDDEMSLLSEVFKNLVSYVNVYGKGEHKRMLRDILITKKEA